MKKLFFTITGCNYRYGTDIFRPGMQVGLVKEPDNAHDREAIKVVMEGLGLVGYVANSIRTVRGLSLSAGRLYDKIGDTATGRVMYVLDDGIICYVSNAAELPEEIDELTAAADDSTPYGDILYDLDDDVKLFDHGDFSETEEEEPCPEEGEAVPEAPAEKTVEVNEADSAAEESEMETAGATVPEAGETKSGSDDIPPAVLDAISATVGSSVDPSVIADAFASALNAVSSGSDEPEAATEEEALEPEDRTPVITKITIEPEADAEAAFEPETDDGEGVTVYNDQPGLTIVHRVDEEADGAAEAADASEPAAKETENGRVITMEAIAEGVNRPLTDTTVPEEAAEEPEPAKAEVMADTGASGPAAERVQAEAETEEPGEAPAAAAEPAEETAELTEAEAQEKKAEELGFKKFEVDSDAIATGDPDLDEKLGSLHLGDLDSRYLSPAFIDKLKKTLSENPYS